jgi:hypothetical protein
MKFDVKQQFDADAAAVMGCYSSSEMYEQLPEFGKISRPDLLDRTATGDTVRIRLRYKFTADLPTAALAIIDPDRLTWVEETTYDLAGLTSRVKLLPDHYASKLEAAASARFVDRGDGSIRNVAGDLRVRVLLVGGQVERAIVDGLKEHLAEEAELVAKLLS